MVYDCEQVVRVVSSLLLPAFAPRVQVQPRERKDDQRVQLLTQVADGSGPHGCVRGQNRSAGKGGGTSTTVPRVVEALEVYNDNVRQGPQAHGFQAGPRSLQSRPRQFVTRGCFATALWRMNNRPQAATHLALVALPRLHLFKHLSSREGVQASLQCQAIASVGLLLLGPRQCTPT